MIKNLLISLTIMLSACAMHGVGLVYAQTISGIVITTDPPFPIPDSIVKVQMETFQFDMDTADIVWYYNGKKIDSGIGKKYIQIKYPSLGETADIRAVATVSGSQNFAAGKRLGGATVNLLSEPIDSYTPIWYRGSAQPTEGGKVKLYAEAYLYSNGKRISSDNLVYNWTINEEPMPDISGLGKSTNIISMDPILGEAYVQLTVKSIDGIYETRAATRVTANAPTLKVYTDENTVYPKYNNYNIIMNTAEKTVIAEPFNSLVDNRNSYFWVINNIPAESTKNTLTLRKGERTSGSVNINVTFENKNILFQSGEFKGVIDYN